MKRHNINSLPRMGRRRFIESLSALGISATTVNFLTQDAAADVLQNSSEEIPFVKYLKYDEAENRRKPVYDTVSRKHWAQTEAAHDAARNLEILIDKNVSKNAKLIEPGVTTISHSRSSEKAVQITYYESENMNKNGDWTQRKPSIDFESLTKIVPSTATGIAGRGIKNVEEKIEDIPIVLKRAKKVDACSGGYYDDEYGASVPGGCRMATDDWIGSLATPAESSTYGRVMTTAGHCVNNKSYIYQPNYDAGNEDGIVTTYFVSDNLDIGMVRAPDGYSGSNYYTYRLANGYGSYKPSKIRGIVTFDTIKYYEGTSYEVKKQGDRTGTTSGIIESTNTNNGHQAVWTTCGSYSGDSGGLIYREEDNPATSELDIFAVGIYAWYWDDNSSCPAYHSGGNTMEYAEQKLNVNVY